MKFAAILPHLKAFGGVRRFIEIGNELIVKGHPYWIFTPKVEVPPWFDFAGYIFPVEAISDRMPDVMLIGDPPSFPLLDRYLKSSENPSLFRVPVYVWVIAGGEYTQQYLRMYARGVPFFVNNRVFLETYPGARLLEGGVNTRKFTNLHGIRSRVGYYAGRGRIKGEAEIVEALGDLDHIELVPIKDYSDRELPMVYKTLDAFVAWEQRPGWSNTAAEAAACGIPVITNGVNTEPFRDRCIVINDLRAYFVDPMAAYSWDRVADKLVDYVQKDHANA